MLTKQHRNFEFVLFDFTFYYNHNFYSLQLDLDKKKIGVLQLEKVWWGNSLVGSCHLMPPIKLTLTRVVNYCLI